jgi:hypothetical protein
MLSSIENALVVIASVAVSLLFMKFLNRKWPGETRRAHNDLIGWQLSVVGTTYAVIIGFMLYTVWVSYGNADWNVGQEANALVNVFRQAAGLPSNEGRQLRALALAYADAVVHQEWAEMNAGKLPDESDRICNKMWALLEQTPTTNPGEVGAKNHILTEISSLTGYRHTRLVECESHIPGILWWVLLVGAAITIASACMFGAASPMLHLVQVGLFSFLIALILVAIADINRPFQGGVHVDDFAFRRAAVAMRTE